MSHQPSRPPPVPGFPPSSSQRSAPYDESEHGYTSPELSPSFLTATVIPSVDDDEAQTVSHATHDAESLRTPSATPASAMQATVFGVQRISPAPAGLAPPSVARPAPAAAQHMAPAVRPSPQPVRQPTPPSQAAQPSGLSAAAAALADEPTGFLHVSAMPSSPSASPASVRAPSTAGAAWLADQPTSWVALQPSESAGSSLAEGPTGGTALARGTRSAAPPALAATPPSGLRPWLLSLGIGLLGGLLALVMIVAAMRYLSSNKSPSSDRRGATSERSQIAAAGELSSRALDDAMSAVQRGEIDRAIDILKAERHREPNPALDSLIESLKRLRSSRKP